MFIDPDPRPLSGLRYVLWQANALIISFNGAACYWVGDVAKRQIDYRFKSKNLEGEWTENPFECRHLSSGKRLELST